jgi:glycosyltransferase involved in cell wall biosynthesis
VVAVGRRTPRTADDEYHQPALANRMQHVIAAVRPDVVHFHALQNLGVEMVRTTVAAGVPTVVTLHDAWWLCERQFMLRATHEWCGQTAIDPRICATCVGDAHQHRERQRESLDLLNSCDRVLTPSRYWREVMLGSGVAADVLQVNGNGVRHPEPGRRRQDASGRPVRFGYVGGGDAVKGAVPLRRALEDLRDVDHTTLLVDAGQALGFHGLRPEAWDVPNVRILPAYSAADIDDFFDSIDVLLFPSQTRESYGLTVREALLRGVWVVATPGGGTEEVLRDGVNATMIPMTSSGEHLAAIMRTIAATPDAYRRRARAITPIPTFDDQARELELIYEDVVASQSRVPEPRDAITKASPHSVPGSW